MKNRFRFDQVPLVTVAVCALAGLASACSSGVEGSEAVGSKEQRYGSYDLVAAYTNPSAPKGWLIEWKIPTLLNPATGVHVIGQWYNNFESGLYHTGDGWFVYYFGDDNGLTGNEPQCDSMWGSGGICHGVFSNLQPGQQVVFKYEFCTAAHVASVSGTQNCLYVDLKDGQGFRFLAEDTNVRPEGAEMYTHDVENFRTEGQIMPQISCSAATKMVRQQIKNSAGSWVTLSGASNWNFSTYSPYKFQNQNLSASPANWESCSRVTAAVAITSSTATQYCANVTVSNSGPGAISNWNLVIDLNQSTMNNNWSATYGSVGGSRYSVTPVFWNAAIPANGSTTVGFCGYKTGTNWTPIVVAEDGL
ncbi:MAG: cellulose binding domain-containing protein [Polyangiaceae bacterium]